MMAAGLGVRSHQPLTPRGVPSPPAEEAVRVLVEAGADVNAVNHGDFTALHGATFRGLNEVIGFLVEQGADIDARDYRGTHRVPHGRGRQAVVPVPGVPRDGGVPRAAPAPTRAWESRARSTSARTARALVETVGGPDGR